MKRGEVRSSLALRDRNRTAKGRTEKPRRYQYQYSPENRAFRLIVTFTKKSVTRADVRAALKAALKDLPKQLHA